MEDEEHSEAAADPAYSFKPSLTGAPWLLRLSPDALLWSAGRRSGSVAYRDIERMRLSFRLISMQRRYLTDIWSKGSPKISIMSTSWKNIVEQQSLNGPYSQFVRELHRRVAASGVRPLCESGSHPFVYWPGVAVYAAVLLGLAGLIVRALQVASYPGALFVAIFGAVFAWQLGMFFKLNKPGRYELDAPPAELLPSE